VNFRSYLFPALLALILHSVILSALFYSWFGYAEDEKHLVPRHVKAQIVDLKSQLKSQQQEKQAEAKRKEEARKQAARKEDTLKEKARKEEARKEEARKQEALKQAQAKKKAEERKQADAKRKAEAKKKADILKKEALKQEALKKEAARKKAEAVKQEALKKKQQEDARRKAEAEKQAERKREAQRLEREQQDQKRREAELAAALAAEESEMQALAEQQATAGYLEYIASEIENNWSRPPSARNGMKVVLSLHLLPTGEVDNVYVVQSSGESHFDDSAIRAVKRVGQFTELQKMDPVLFDRNFRKLTLEYKPSDLRR